MKKNIMLFILMLILFIASYKSYIYFNSYHINGTEKELEQKILNKIDIQNISIKNSIDLDNKKYILFIADHKLGSAVFKKGLNNKYKMGSVSYGTNPIKLKIVKTNKAKYFLLLGKNPKMEISYAKLLLENKKYKINIPKEEYFIAFCKVNNNIKTIYPDINSITFFNANKNVITNEILSQNLP